MLVALTAEECPVTKSAALAAEAPTNVRRVMALLVPRNLFCFFGIDLPGNDTDRGRYFDSGSIVANPTSMY